MLNHELERLLHPAFKDQAYSFPTPYKIVFVLDLKMQTLANDKEAMGLIHSKIGKSGLYRNNIWHPDLIFSLCAISSNLLKMMSNVTFWASMNANRLGHSSKWAVKWWGLLWFSFIAKTLFTYGMYSQIISLSSHRFFLTLWMELFVSFTKLMLASWKAFLLNLLISSYYYRKMLSFDDQLSPHFKRDVYEVIYRCH